MTNAELKHLVGLYHQTKKELDELKGDSERGDIELKLYEKLAELLKKNAEKARKNDFARYRFLTEIYEGIFYPEHAEIDKKYHESVKKTYQAEAKRKITYLEIKLEAITQLLGQENLNDLEKFEKEKILKEV